MSDFNQNIFPQQIPNPNQIQINPNVQNLEMLRQLSQNQNINNINQSPLYQMAPNQFAQNNQIDMDEDMDMDMNQIINFNSSNDNIDNQNQNNPNSNLNLQNKTSDVQMSSNKDDINLIIKNDNDNNIQMRINTLNSQVTNQMNLNNDQENANNTTEEKQDSPKTKLENKFSFLYRIDDSMQQHQTQKQVLAKEKYESQVKKIADFDTIEEFWGIFQHLRKPDSCKPGIEYFMFKEPIKPLWEDEHNKNGGRFSIKLKRGYTTIIWEEMIFTLIGGILPKEIKEEINGIVVTSKKEFNTLQIWFRNFDEKIVQDLEQCIRELLVIPDEVRLDPKKFNVSSNNNNSNSNNIKKEYDNNNNSYNNKNNNKSGGFRDKGYYNNNYYGEGGYRNYNKEHNKKNKHQSYKNKK
jgi:translation initiation factor 4E